MRRGFGKIRTPVHGQELPAHTQDVHGCPLIILRAARTASEGGILAGKPLFPAAMARPRFPQKSGRETAAEGKIVFSLSAPPLRYDASGKFFAQTGYAPRRLGHEFHGRGNRPGGRFSLRQFLIGPHNAASADEIPLKEWGSRKGAGNRTGKPYPERHAGDVAGQGIEIHAEKAVFSEKGSTNKA